MLQNKNKICPFHILQKQRNQKQSEWKVQQPLSVSPDLTASPFCHTTKDDNNFLGI